MCAYVCVNCVVQIIEGAAGEVPVAKKSLQKRLAKADCSAMYHKAKQYCLESPRRSKHANKEQPTNFNMFFNPL